MKVIPSFQTIQTLFNRVAPLSAVLASALLFLSGCGAGKPSEGWVGFVVNQDQHQKQQDSAVGPGKSYKAQAASLSSTPSGFELDASSKATTSEKIRIQIQGSGDLAAQVGKTLVVSTGQLLLDGKTLDLSGGSFTLQSLSGGTAQGNFSVRVKDHNPPWEVVGCFVTLNP